MGLPVGVLAARQGFLAGSKGSWRHPLQVGGWPRLVGFVLATWYVELMSGTHAIVMGDRGRLVIPAEVRSAANLEPGTPLILVESSSGLLLLTRAQAKAMIKTQLAGRDVVAELLAERRAEALSEWA